MHENGVSSDIHGIKQRGLLKSGNFFLRRIH